MFDKEIRDTVLKVPYTIILVSFILLFVTTGMNDANGVSSLMGGYFGLLIGLLFVVMFSMPPFGWIDMLPLLFLMCLVSLIIYFLFTYYDRIVQGYVSDYYQSFSFLSIVFMAVQLSILYSYLSKNTSLPPKIGAFLALIGTFNAIIVTTLGITLHYYSTQG